MAAVSTYSESATYCPSVLGRDLVGTSGEQEFCTPIIDERIRTVLIVGVVGLVLVVAGVARGRSRLFGHSPLPGRVSVVTRVGLVILGLITLLLSFPLWVAYVFLADSMAREGDDFFRAMFPVGMALAAVTAAAMASVLGRREHRLTLDHAMTATALGAPLMALVLVDLNGLGVTAPGLIDPAWTSSAPRYVVCGVPIAVALLVAVAVQNRARPAPPAGVSGLAVLASATALFLAMVPDAFNGGYGGGTDQSIGRFTFWIVVAVGLPWMTFGAWKLSEAAGAPSPNDVHSSLA
jgi:hypothetical protein